MSYHLRELTNNSEDEVENEEQESTKVSKHLASLMLKCVESTSKQAVLNIPRSKRKEKIEKKVDFKMASEFLSGRHIVGPPSSFACVAMAKTIIARYGGYLEDKADEKEPGPAQPDDDFLGKKVEKTDQLVGASLTCLFEILEQLSRKDSDLCTQALDTLLGLIQKMPIEGLRSENKCSIGAMLTVLMQMRQGGCPSVCSRASSCLAALAVASGQPEYLMAAARSLLCTQRMETTSLNSTYDAIQIPENLHRLLLLIRRKFHDPRNTKPAWSEMTIDSHWVTCSFDLPTLPSSPGDETPDDDNRLYASIACDGSYVYLLNHIGLYKLGTGLQETIIGKLYASNQAMKATKNCMLSLFNGSLYLRRNHSSCMIVIDIDSLIDIGEVILPTGSMQNAIFTDGTTFYSATASANSMLTTIPLTDSFVPTTDVNLRKKYRLTDICFEFGGELSTFPRDLVKFIPANLHGQIVDFHIASEVAFIQSKTGKVYYAGNASRFGLQETGSSWMELVLPESVVQISVGGENVMFRSNGGHVWIACVDEKKKNGRLRRLAPPNRRKVIHVCANDGAFAYVTENGKIFVGGKITSKVSFSPELMSAMESVHMSMIALGKTHGAAVTRHGQLYTWGMNNLLQCGRSSNPSTSPYQKNSPCTQDHHVYVLDVPSTCAKCGLCSANGSACGLKPRPKGTRCECGKGETTCLRCNTCRSCCETEQPKSIPFSSAPAESRAVLAPARMKLLKGSQECKVSTISVGNFHAVVLTQDRTVFTFGSNVHGQLGCGDTSPKLCPQMVRLPTDSPVAQVAAGANHTVVRTADGSVYTFGAHSKGQLCREADETPCWHAKAGRVPGYGPGYPGYISWIGAYGDLTIFHNHTALVTNDDVINSQIVASKNDLFIFPREVGREAIVIERRMTNRFDHLPMGTFSLYTFWAMEPRHDLLWSYNAAEMRIEAFSVFEKDELRLERTKKNLELLPYQASPEFSVPIEAPAFVSSIQLGIHLLTSTFAANSICNSEFWVEKSLEVDFGKEVTPSNGYSVVSRFEGTGGGWGYSAHSVEAVQFKVSKEIRLVGVGLFGGRGEYVSKLKLYRLIGGDADELYVEQITETDETAYECGAHETATLLFSQPIIIQANQWHVVSAKIRGPSSDCGASGKEVVDCDGVTFSFRNSVISNNGTDITVGQIPEFYYQLNQTADQTCSEDALKVSDLSMSQVITTQCLLNVTPAVITALLEIFSWSLDRVLNSVEESEEKLWERERVAFISIISIKLLSRYLCHVYGTNDENSIEFAKVTTKLHTCLFALFSNPLIVVDENIPLQKVMAEAVKLFKSLSHCFLGSRPLINAHLYTIMTGNHSEMMTAAVIGCIQKMDKIFVEFLTEDSKEDRFPVLSALLIDKFELEKDKIETITSFPNILRFLFDLCFQNFLWSINEISQMAQEIIVRISKELALPDNFESLTPTIHQTSPRFRKKSTQMIWDMSDACPDAIAFRVDAEGIKLHGFGIYLPAAIKDQTFAGEIYMLSTESKEKWTCLMRVTGDVSNGDKDMGYVRFQDHVLLSPGVTYALKLTMMNNVKTFCGEGGTSQIRLCNGTRVYFSACGLSQNGTTVQRGQIPFLLYSVCGQANGKVTQEKVQENFLLLLRLLSNKIGICIGEGTLPDCARTLISMISSHVMVFMERNPTKCLETMAVLEQLIPLVAGMNGVRNEELDQSKSCDLSEADYVTTTVESSHPYKPNSVASMMVTFDESIDFMCVRFSDKCETSQFDDQLSLYLGVDEHSYIPVEKCFGSNDWPKHPIFLPGNALWFVLETSTQIEGVSDQQMYGFHVAVTGYPAGQKTSNLLLEQELVWLSANACRIMCQLPLNSCNIEHLSVAEDDTRHLFERHGGLLKKGLSLSHAPTLSELVTRGHPPPAHSPEVQFLREFLAGQDWTTAGALAKWLPTGAVVEPTKCHLAFSHEEMVVGKPVKMKFSSRDQFEREVECSKISVEVVASLKAQSSSAREFTCETLPTTQLIQQNPFQPTIVNHAKYMNICAMPAYSNYSMEEVRLGYIKEEPVKDKIKLRHKTMSVFSGTWTPAIAGNYVLEVKVDGHDSLQSYSLQVVEQKDKNKAKVPFRGSQLASARTVCVPYTSDYSGLRMRLGTSLSSACVGVIPRGSLVEYIEEIENEDGRWIRLTDETALLHGYTGGASHVWCMTYHRALRRKLINVGEEKEPGVRMRRKKTTADEKSHKYQNVSMDAKETYLIPEGDVLQVYSHPSPDGILDGEKISGPSELISNGWMTNEYGVWIKISGTEKYVLQQGDVSCELDSSLTFSTNGNEDESPKTSKETAVPKALPPSVADCARAVFAAFVWHEHLVRDLMAASAYLKFHQNLHHMWDGCDIIVVNNAPSALQPIVKVWREIFESVEVGVSQHLIVAPVSDRSILYEDTKKIGDCELCDEVFKVPLAVHLRMSHPGCESECMGYGYNSNGRYTSGWSGLCGTGGRNSLWYLLCPECRMMYLKKTPAGHQQEMTRRWREFRLTTSEAECKPEVIIKQNALFLLDLNSRLESDSKTSSTATSGWQINLFPTMSSTPSTMPRSTKAKFHLDSSSIARSSYMGRSLSGRQNSSEPCLQEGHQLVSPPNTSLNNTMNYKVNDPQEVLQSPSAALRTLFSSTCPSTSSLLKRPVLAFCIQHHNLKKIRSACVQSVYRAVAFSHAFRVWNWLLRMVSTETSVSDVIFQYITALTSYNRLTEYTSNVARKHCRVLPHPWRLCFLAGPVAGDMVGQLHAFLYTISVILQSNGVDGRLRSLCFKAWTLQLTAQEQDLLILTCNILATVGGVLSEVSAIDLSALDKSSDVDVKETCDVTLTARIEASSRQAMVVCLTDQSPETFWESGDEDKNRARLLTVTIPDDVIGLMVGIYMDNVRDEAYRNTSATFKLVLADGSKKEIHSCTFEDNFCGWAKCCIANVKTVQIALKGPGVASRIRQLMLLGFNSKEHAHSSLPPSTSHQLLFNNTQSDAFALFQAISSQAFCGELSEDETLRERVIDLLFSRVQLNPLQTYVCTQVVQALEREVQLLCQREKRNYSYSCGLMELVVRICDADGASDLTSQRTSILTSISQILIFAPEIVQKQCLNSLECLFGSFPPQNVDVSKILRNLLVVVGKVMQLQVRDKVTHAVNTAYFCSSIQNAPQGWRLDRSIDSEIGKRTADLISSICDGVYSIEWADAFKVELADCVVSIAQSTESLTESSTLTDNLGSIVASKRFWISITALSLVKNEEWLDMSERWQNLRERINEEPFTVCENHDDGQTAAKVFCTACEMSLCRECFTIMHLNKKNRNHFVKLLTQTAVRYDVNIHQGCARLRINNLLILLHGKALNGMVEMSQETFFDDAMNTSNMVVPSHNSCRFCGNRVGAEHVNIDGICTHEECVEYAKTACSKTLPCGHFCCGIKDEQTCLPCLTCEKQESCQDSDDVCVVCFTERLGAAPCIHLKCGHIFHFHCIRQILEKRWSGPRILFRFINCPLCNQNIEHEGLDDLLEPIKKIRDEVIAKGKMRLEYDQLLNCTALTDERSEFFGQPEEYALDRYMYVLCAKCGKAYFGGEARCQNALDTSQYDPEDLICGACSDPGQVQICPRHGVEFLEYKCRYCCSIAVYFCFGNTHFCAPCHNDFQRLRSLPKIQLPKCPVGPRSVPLEEGPCPLKMEHPATGEEFAMGCGICRNISTF